MQDFSYTKTDRILKRWQFLYISEHGKKIHHKYFIAVFCPGKTAKNRLGITVTKKTGCAVIRNRIKRLCREYFRQNRHNLTGIWDINIIARKDVINLSSEEIFISLENIFDKIAKIGSNTDFLNKR